MKKYLMFLFALVMMIAFVGCGKDVDPEEYTIDKELKAKEEVTLEEAKVEVETVDEKEANDKIKTLKVISTSKYGEDYSNSTILFDNSGEKLNAKIDVETKVSNVSTTTTQYIKEGYMYVNVLNFKYKVAIPEDESDVSSLSEVDSLLDGVFDKFTAETEGLKIFKDGNGSLVVDYSGTDGKFRLVINDNKLVYCYYGDTKETMVFEMKFFYNEKIEFEFPEFEGYKEEDWDILDSIMG